MKTWYRATRIALGPEDQVAAALGIEIETLHAREHGEQEITPEAVFALRYLIEHPDRVR